MQYLGLGIRKPVPLLICYVSWATYFCFDFVSVTFIFTPLSKGLYLITSEICTEPSMTGSCF